VQGAGERHIVDALTEANYSPNVGQGHGILGLSLGSKVAGAMRVVKDR
jgi:hypothetical protein